jgi:hypothetical protein
MTRTEAPGPRSIGSSAHIASEWVTGGIVEQSKQDMIWDAKAVNRISKCNPGSQTFWFEMCLPVVQCKTCVIARRLARLVLW